jgi:hypothetical protein
VLRYSLLMLLVVFCTSAAIVALASVTPIIPNYVEREYAEHRRSNGILFFDGGYRDDGDFLLLGEIFHLVARFSAVIPIWPTPNGSVSTATIMSIALLSPMRAPLRKAGNR